MQIIPPQPIQFLPLIAIIPLGLASVPPLHLFLLTALLLLKPSPTENYCNAIASVLLCVVLGIDNLHTASKLIFEYTSSSLMEMQSNVLLDWRIWVLLFEGAFFVLWGQYCYGKYKEYRSELLI